MQLDTFTAFSLVALTTASSASAGMLMVEVYGLKEIAASGDASALATVVTKADAKKREMTVKVERVFGVSKRFKVGETAKVTLAKLEVEWTDPGESPIDEQLRASLGNADVGARVLVVPSRKGDAELLAATDANILKAAVLYDSDGERARWLASPVSTLEGGLADEDLAHLAAAELKKRGALTVAQVMKSAERFAFAHVKALTHDERRRFLEDGLAVAKLDHAAAERLFRMAVLDPCPSSIAPLAQIIPLVDSKRWDDARLALLLVAKKNTEGRCPKGVAADLSPFVEFLAGYWQKRPAHQRTGDDQFALLTDRMDRAAQSKLAVLLLSNVSTEKGIDGFLLDGAAQLATKAPSPELVAPLTKLAPIKGDKKMAYPASMLAIGSAVVEKFPAERARVQAVLQPYLDWKVPVEEPVLARYRKVVGELAPQKPVAESFQLRPGEMRRLADGAQVSLRVQNGEPVLWFAHLKHSGNLLRELDVDGYHEWWVEPYVLTADGPKDRVTITVTPHASMPAQVSDAEANALAEAKCGARKERDFKAWLGRITYTGTKGRCVVGAFTKTVIVR